MKRNYFIEMFKKWDWEGEKYIPDTAKFWSFLFLSVTFLTVTGKVFFGLKVSDGLVLGLMGFAGGFLAIYKLSKQK